MSRVEAPRGVGERVHAQLRSDTKQFVDGGDVEGRVEVVAVGVEQKAGQGQAVGVVGQWQAGERADGVLTIPLKATRAGLYQR
jgi:hypothetical protein